MNGKCQFRWLKGGVAMALLLFVKFFSLLADKTTKESFYQALKYWILQLTNKVLSDRCTVHVLYLRLQSVVSLYFASEDLMIMTTHLDQ